MDDVAIIGIIFLVLWLFHTEISLPLAIFMGLVFVALSFITYKLLLPAYRRKKTTGVEGMVGLRGMVVECLEPEGLIKIKNEYWKAKAIEGNIPAGETVEVIEADGLLLKVRRIKE